MSDLSVKLINTRPSHHTDEKDTQIDSICVDKCDTVVSSDRHLPNYPSRHGILSVTIEIFYPEPPNILIKYKPINTITAHDLNSHLANHDWTAFSPEINDFDIEQRLSTLTNNIHSAIDILAPDKTLRPEKLDFLDLIQSFAY